MNINNGMTLLFDNLPDMLPTKRLAELFGISDDTVWRMCREGVLPAIKIGHRWYVPKQKLTEVVSDALLDRGITWPNRD